MTSRSRAVQARASGTGEAPMGPPGEPVAPPTEPLTVLTDPVVQAALDAVALPVQVIDIDGITPAPESPARHERPRVAAPSTGRAVVAGAGSGHERDRAARLLGALFSSAPVGLGVFDLQGRFTRVNPVLADMGDRPPQDHLGLTVQEACPPLGARAHAAVLDVLRTGRPVLDLELNTVPGTGPERVFVTSFVRLHDEQDRPAGAGCLVMEVTDQRRLERERAAVTARLALTSRASRILGSSLDPAATLEHLAGLLVPGLADHLLVDLVEQGGRLRRVAVRHAPGLMVSPRLAGPVGTWPDYDRDHPMRRAVQEGRVTLVRVADDDPPARPERPGRRDRRARAGVVSSMAIPLVAGGHVIGAASLQSSASGRHFDADDVQLAQEIVSRAAVALANALSYERQRSAAVALQRSLLPDSMPALEGVETAWRYVPGMDGTEAGGDWIESFALPGGRVGLIAGDVMGRGLRAAAVMGQLRMAVRTLALGDPPPAELLSRLDVIVTGLRAGQIVTCVYAVYDPASGSITLANAGHMPPIVLGPQPGVWRRIDDALAVPLGVGGVDFVQTDVPLPTGAVLALYTDGLVERPGRDLDRSIARFAERLSSAGGSLDDWCDAALDAARPEPAAGRPGQSDAAFDDDVALLLARATAVQDGRVARDRLPCEAASVARARAMTVQALREWGLDGPDGAAAGSGADETVSCDLLTTATLLVSEVVTNAIRHSRSPVGFQLRLGRDALWIEVSDDDARPPRLRHARPDDEGGRGLELVQELSSAWGSRPSGEGKVVWLRLALPGTR